MIANYLEILGLVMWYIIKIALIGAVVWLTAWWIDGMSVTAGRITGSVILILLVAYGIYVCHWKG